MPYNSVNYVFRFLTMGVKDKKKDKKKDKGKDKKASKVKSEPSASNGGPSPKKRVKKEEEEPEVWRWWEEDHHDTTQKWKFLEHQGPYFPPPYDPLPNSIHFLYDGKSLSYLLHKF